MTSENMASPKVRILIAVGFVLFGVVCGYLGFYEVSDGKLRIGPADIEVRVDGNAWEFFWFMVYAAIFSGGPVLMIGVGIWGGAKAVKDINRPKRGE